LNTFFAVRPAAISTNSALSKAFNCSTATNLGDNHSAAALAIPVGASPTSRMADIT
jgi:hypothetical protein